MLGCRWLHEDGIAISSLTLLNLGFYNYTIFWMRYENKNHSHFHGVSIFVTVSSSYAATLYISDTCTLTDAILSANTNTATGGCNAGDATGTDTIVLEKNKLYRITAAYETSSDGKNGLPSITSSIKIIGQSAVIEKKPDPFLYTRIFHISETGHLILDKITIEGGVEEDKNGGGIYNSGILDLRECTIKNNSSLLAGSGIFNKSGTIFVRGSTFLNNSPVAGSGGAIYNKMGIVEVYSSIFSENTGIGSGGAVFNSKDGTFRITQSTFFNNVSEFEGGSVANEGNMIISSCTFDHNRHFDNGGVQGIYNSKTGKLSLYNSTVSNTDSLVGLISYGISIYNEGQMEIINSTLFRDQTDSQKLSSIIVNKDGVIEIGNSIVAGVIGDDCAGDQSNPQETGTTILDDLGHNWFADDSCTGVANGDPKLEPLSNNGGSTKTHAIGEESELIDMGDDALCSSIAINNFDQRGERRPQGEHCDIGAFEKRDNAGQSTNPSIIKLLLLH